VRINRDFFVNLTKTAQNIINRKQTSRNMARAPAKKAVQKAKATSKGVKKVSDKKKVARSTSPHHSYGELVLKAVRATSKFNHPVSRQKIAAYIEEQVNHEPNTGSLRAALKKAVESGVLDKVSSSYKIGDAGKTVIAKKMKHATKKATTVALPKKRASATKKAVASSKKKKTGTKRKAGVPSHADAVQPEKKEKKARAAPKDRSKAPTKVPKKKIAKSS